MLARPFILQAEMLARICPRIASLSENIRQKTSSRVDTRLVSVASESDRGSIPLLSYTCSSFRHTCRGQEWATARDRTQTLCEDRKMGATTID